MSRENIRNRVSDKYYCNTCSVPCFLIRVKHRIFDSKSLHFPGFGHTSRFPFRVRRVGSRDMV